MELHGHCLYSVIEGIGCDKSLLHTLYPSSPGKVAIPPKLLAVYHRDKIIWEMCAIWKKWLEGE